MQKRGQITVYFIIGFIIILTVVSAFVLRDFFLKSALEREYSKYANVPEQAKPIKELMDTCLTDITYEALVRAGLQSGYVYVPTDNLPLHPTEPFSNRLTLQSGQEVPYWFYETSNGVQRYQVPTQKEIEEQISTFITENIKLCVNSLNMFIDEDYSFEFNFKPKPKIQIEDERTLVELELPITISLKDFTFNLDKHFAEVKVPFGRFYKVAKYVQEYEDDTNFFEEKSFDVITAYKEIPLSGTDLSCAEKTWLVEDIKKELRDLLSLNMGTIKLKEQNSETDKYYTLGVNLENANSMFLYSPQWPLSLRVEPSNNGILRSDQITRKFSDVTGPLGLFLCIDNYHFIYDLKYPLLVSLFDADANNGAGYVFQFAEQVIIKSNQPRENKLGNLEVPDFSYPICNNPVTNITVFTFGADESGSLRPLDGVKVSFKCFSTQCDMGITESETTSEAMLSAIFPFCMNGALIGEKEGYYPAKTFLTTDSEKYISLILEPLVEKEVEIKLIDKNTGVVRDPYDSEKVIFEFKNLDNDYTTALVYPDTNKLTLVSGNYKVSSYVIGSSTWPITVRGGEIEKCIEKEVPTILGIFNKEKECFPVKIDDLVLEEVVKGGVTFDWQVDSQVLFKPRLTVYTMVGKFPSTQEELTIAYSSIEKNEKSQYFRYPE